MLLLQLSESEVAGIIALYVILFLLFIGFIVIMKSFKVVRQAEVMIVERMFHNSYAVHRCIGFGKYHTTLKPGLHFLVPFVDNARVIDWRYVEVPLNRNFGVKVHVSPLTATVGVVRKKLDRIDMREHVIDLGLQRVITKDTVAMDIDALVVWIVAAKKY